MPLILPLKRLIWAVHLPLAIFPFAAGASDVPSVRNPTDIVELSPDPYKTTFDRYKSFELEPVANWRSTNDRVLATGGHAGALREGAPSNPQPKLDSNEVPAGAARQPVQSEPLGGHGRHSGN